MARPEWPTDGENPYGNKLRTGLNDISDRADNAISNAASADAKATTADTKATSAQSSSATNATNITNLTTTVGTKADDNVVVKLSGNQTIAGTKTFSSSPGVPDGAFAIAKVSGLQIGLDGKAPLSHSHDASALNAGTLNYDRLPAGTTLTVAKSGGTWPSRPTSRTDIIVQWKGADPSPVTGGSGMVNNVDTRLITP